MSLVKLTPIIDPVEFVKLKRLKDGLVEVPANITSDWLRTRDWKVVPVESPGHFLEKDASLVAQAFQKMECATVFALATEDLNPSDSNFLVGISPQCLLEFSVRCAHFNFLLTPSNRAAAVLCTVY